LKNQWNSIDEEQAANFDDWSVRKSFITKGVSQTNFEDNADHTSKLKLMNDVLYSYNFYNWNLGYSEGMNLLLLPFVHIFEDEVDVFWCFKGLMDEISTNFNYKQNGLLVSIFKLGKLINLMDPWFYGALARSESLHLMYCVRWIQVGFIGVFPLEEIYFFWDVLWTQYHPDFILFFIFGILLQCREKILVYHGQEWPFEEILEEIDLLSRKLNLFKCLNVATALHNKFCEKGFSLSLEETHAKKESSEATE